MADQYDLTHDEARQIAEDMIRTNEEFEVHDWEYEQIARRYLDLANDPVRAAAPRLLEALEAVKAEWVSLAECMGATPPQYSDIVEAAIAAARGEA